MVIGTHDLHSNDKICLECNREFTGIISNCPHDNSILFTRMQDPFVGTILAGNYEIQSVIGHGGMGVVYKARQTLVDRIVAIKMLQAQLVSDSMSVKRFQQEAKAASRINHPHVITVYDFGISPTGQPYIVMDYLEGRSLADVIKNDGQVPVERAIRILMQSCDALDHAHKQGVVHRDLKPTNIVLSRYDGQDDFVRVVDFGVAKLMESGTDGQRLTQAGEVCGSPVYMSPEQCMGMDLDPRSDIYSMGVVIYETLTGKLPILGKTMVDTMSKHISDAPARFSESRPDLYIPERLEAVIFKALAKDPNDRHQTMEELRVDLDVAIPRPGRSEVLRSLPHPEAYATKKAAEEGPSRPPLKIIIPAAAVIVAGLIGGGMFMINSKKAEPPKPAPPAIVAPAPVTSTVAPGTTETAKTPAAAPPGSTTAVAPPVKPATTTPPVQAAAVEAKHTPPKAHKPPKPHVVAEVRAPKPKSAAPKADAFSDLKNLRSY